MSTKTIKFLIAVEYENEEDGPICAKSMCENMQSAVENERQNNSLTPVEISANHVTTEIEYEGPLEFNN